MKRIIILSFLLILLNSIKAQQADNEKFECILPIEWNPEFKGGQRALKLFLSKNLKYPKTNACVNGKVYVQFIVEKDGRITNPEIIKSLEQKFDEEALRVIRLMPKWNPGRDYQGKKAIVTRFTMPIKFEIEE
jgi:periplasmic protein TonB